MALRAEEVATNAQAECSDQREPWEEVKTMERRLPPLCPQDAMELHLPTNNQRLRWSSKLALALQARSRLKQVVLREWRLPWADVVTSLAAKVLILSRQRQLSAPAPCTHVQVAVLAGAHLFEAPQLSQALPLVHSERIARTPRSQLPAALRRRQLPAELQATERKRQNRSHQLPAPQVLLEVEQLSLLESASSQV